MPRPNTDDQRISGCGGCGCSSGILGKSYCSGPGAVVGLDVDERDRAAVNLPLGAVQSRANFVGAFDIFAVAAERFGHLVEARVAKIAAGACCAVGRRSSHR